MGKDDTALQLETLLRALGKTLAGEIPMLQQYVTYPGTTHISIRKLKISGELGEEGLTLRLEGNAEACYGAGYRMGDTWMPSESNLVKFDLKYPIPYEKLNPEHR